MEDGSAVRLVRPNGADAKLRARTDRCRATYSGSRFLGKDYTFIAEAKGLVGGVGGADCIGRTSRETLRARSHFKDRSEALRGLRLTPDTP